jgi:hypothetical protein
MDRKISTLPQKILFSQKFIGDFDTKVRIPHLIKNDNDEKL